MVLAVGLGVRHLEEQLHREAVLHRRVVVGGELVAQAALAVHHRDGLAQRLVHARAAAVVRAVGGVLARPVLCGAAAEVDVEDVGAGDLGRDDGDGDARRGAVDHRADVGGAERDGGHEAALGIDRRDGLVVGAPLAVVGGVGLRGVALVGGGELERLAELQLRGVLAHAVARDHDLAGQRARAHGEAEVVVALVLEAGRGVDLRGVGLGAALGVIARLGGVVVLGEGVEDWHHKRAQRRDVGDGHAGGAVRAGEGGDELVGGAVVAREQFLDDAGEDRAGIDARELGRVGVDRGEDEHEIGGLGLAGVVGIAVHGLADERDERAVVLDLVAVGVHARVRVHRVEGGLHPGVALLVALEVVGVGVVDDAKQVLAGVGWDRGVAGVDEDALDHVEQLGTLDAFVRDDRVEVGEHRVEEGVERDVARGGDGGVEVHHGGGHDAAVLCHGVVHDLCGARVLLGRGREREGRGGCVVGVVDGDETVRGVVPDADGLAEHRLVRHAERKGLVRHGNLQPRVHARVPGVRQVLRQELEDGAVELVGRELLGRVRRER